MLSFEYKHFLRHKLKDALYNFYLCLRSDLNSNKKWNAGKAKPPSGYNLVFNEDFKRPGLDPNKWGEGQPWGNFHPDYIHQWYGSGIDYNKVEDGILKLSIKNDPKKFRKDELPEWQKSDVENDEFIIPVGIGMIHTKKAWQYGWFESEIKLPKGQSYWNAFWLAGVNTWPPEIDIFEAYTHFGPNYESPTILRKFRKRPNRRIRPNLHYGTANLNKMHYVAYDVPVYKCTERFVQYACLWEKDKIEIYFDGRLVLRCTDPEILKWYNKENAEQQIIINHGQHYAHTHKVDEVPMQIKNVKVYQKS